MGGARSPSEFAERACEAVGRGYRGLKFDPFGVVWKDMDTSEREAVVAIVAAVREAAGPNIDLMIEFHGRLSVGEAVLIMREIEQFKPAWCEEPVAPESLDLLMEVKRQARSPIAAGEPLYTIADFYRLTTLRAADVVQMDVAHCGGIGMSKKIAAMAAVQDMRFAPHYSVGPVALAAALHLDINTPNFMVQEAFVEFDIPWRNSLVRGWNPISNGEFFMDDTPGLGLELDDEVIAQHPYIQNPFPSLWDGEWVVDFTQDKKS
jgi:galactonate dehydratase